MNNHDPLIIQSFPPVSYGVNEALNTLWTNISYSGANIKTLSFTSCRENEGKSFITMYLGRMIASTGKRVLIIDGDLRKSVLVGTYQIGNRSGRLKGLAHYLAGHSSMEEIVYPTNYNNLYMILAGHEVLNSFALLDNPLLEDLMTRVREEFDIILVDSAPVGAIIDPALIARHCDGTVIVVKENNVARQELLEARIQIENVGGRVLGVVMNNVAVDEKKYYRGRYYGRGYYHGYYGSNAATVKRDNKNRKSRG